jgi:hypothetical protein
MSLVGRKTSPIQYPTGATNLSRLLAGLEAQRAELGELADDLIAALRGAGVTPPPRPGFIHGEFAGPWH